MLEGPLSTSGRIYDAAVTEFAAGGLDGATIDGIARRAGVNRERVYSYFGGKRSLFFHVTSSELTRLAEAVPMIINASEDVATYAGQAFDYQHANPAIARLVLWEGLIPAPRRPANSDTARRQIYEKKIQTVNRAQQLGIISDELEPGEFVFSIISLASYWLAAPHLASTLVPAESEVTAVKKQRKAVISAARRLATPIYRS